MGQQQLLLVILVTIIVGIATVVAINIYSAQSDKANVDAVRQNMFSMAAAAHPYFMKPVELGGGGQDFSNVTMEDLAFPGNIGSTTTGTNLNGDFSLGSRSPESFKITGEPANAGGSLVMTVEMTVQGDTSYISKKWAGGGGGGVGGS